MSSSPAIESVQEMAAAETRLGRAVSPLLQAHRGKSGVFGLPDGRDAFAARSLLCDAGERTIDACYYIWNNDLSGMLLFDALRRAAERDVFVRVLLDDNNTAGLDTLLAALDSHRNIQVRLFNPFKIRRWRLLGYLTDFARLNRRMHNKSFTVDNQATIIGGRNVGDEYFGASQRMSFADLDVLAIGPVVKEVSQDFERYWNSGSSYPASRVLPRVSGVVISARVEATSSVEQSAAAAKYTGAIRESPFVKRMLARELPFEWANTLMLSDDPAKVLGRARKDELLWTRLRRILDTPHRELKLVSPYFVPGAKGVKFFVGLAKRGIKVTLVTNSLEATDVPAVHAGYAKHRKKLLRAGVSIFEIQKLFGEAPIKRRGPAGSSNASLHAKTFVIDRSRAFVGSFNFDPRSARLNTEMGFLINSPALAEAIADGFSNEIPIHAYQVQLNHVGGLQWVEQGAEKQIVHDREPGTSVLRRLGVSLLSLLPIEWLL